jgi:hypothetical protein
MINHSDSHPFYTDKRDLVTQSQNKSYITSYFFYTDQRLFATQYESYITSLPFYTDQQDFVTQNQSYKTSYPFYTDQ